MKFFAHSARGRDNNFNLVRAIAASAVLLSHCWPMVIGPNAIEPLFKETEYTLGVCSVFVFFAISGFFISKSFDQRSSTLDFCIARLARLYPALIVMLVLTVVILGLAFSTLDIRSYFSRGATWSYVPRNLTLRFGQLALPGVFSNNPYGDGINGSLWTLAYEVACYGMVMAVGLFSLLRPRRFAIFLLGFLAIQLYFRWGDVAPPRNNFLLLSLPFVAGMMCYAWRSYVPLSALLALTLCIFAVLLRSTWVYHLVFPIALGYVSLWAGLVDVPIARRYNSVGDYSYGIYIYAFPIQQAIIAITGPISPWALAAIALPITLGFAVLSWMLIERVALSRRHALAQVLATQLFGRRDRNEAR